MEIFVDMLGYLASILVFTAFYVKRIMPLRLIALSSNIAFIAYASFAHLLPIVILHSLLLPLNLQRILELRKKTAVPAQSAQLAANAFSMPANKVAFNNQAIVYRQTVPVMLTLGEFKKQPLVATSQEIADVRAFFDNTAADPASIHVSATRRSSFSIPLQEREFLEQG